MYNKPSFYLAALVITASSFFALAHQAQAATSITDCTGLQNINNSLSSSYVLANDINCNETMSWSENFLPIGSVGTPFTGTLDGQGFTIDGIYIAGIASYTGVFKAIGSAGVVKNLAMTDLEITGGAYTGGVVGYHEGTIQNVYVTGWVTNFGSSYAGGIAGLNHAGTILNSYSQASISATGNYAGGLVGLHYEAGVITNSYATGTVSSATAGGLVGYAYGTAGITNSFWDTQTSGLSSSSGGTGKTTTEMTTASTFTNASWDFNSIWGIASSANGGYPYLYWQGPTVSNITSTTANGLYGVGSVIAVNVTFSRAVTSTGDVTVTLETGTTDRTCAFTIANATTGSCNYTIQTGDYTDDLTVNTVSGTIADATGFKLVNTVPATNLAANKTLIIETTAPTVTLASSDVTNGGSMNASSAIFTATFSEAITGFTADDITVSNATVSGFTETTAGTVYTFTVTPTIDGSVTIDISGGVAQDIASNPNTAATQYTFTYTSYTSLIIITITFDNNILIINYSNDIIQQILTNFKKKNVNYDTSDDDSRLLVSDGKQIKVYVGGQNVSSGTIGKKALKAEKYALKVKSLYSNYDTVVVVTPTKLTVSRLMPDNTLKKKKSVTFANTTGKVPTLSFNTKKKLIQLNFSNKEQLSWKLLKSGKLQSN